MKTSISPSRQPKTEHSANPIDFLGEDLVLVPASGIPEEFRKLSRFLPVIVLVPKSALQDKTTQNKPGARKSINGLVDTSDVCLPLDAAKAWSRNPNATDTFEFGGVSGCFSTMEICRNGRPVILTCKEFKTLAYLVKNPRRVISRDELLSEVWGYENQSTRKQFPRRFEKRTSKVVRVVRISACRKSSCCTLRSTPSA